MWWIYGVIQPNVKRNRGCLLAFIEKGEKYRREMIERLEESDSACSAKSEKFINNLHLYLMTSGKKDTEINEITEEL
jgi:hypothetical protein